jgi:hypothetical protein
MNDAFAWEMEGQVRTILMADSDLLAAMAVFVRGILPDPVPQHYFPFAEILVDTEDEDAGGTTAMDFYVYRGFLQFTALVPDNLAPVAKLIDVPSYQQVKAWAHRAMLLLNAAQSLNGLVSADTKEAVRSVEVTLPKYGIAQSRGRPNNVDALAMVEFTVHTVRSKV